MYKVNIYNFENLIESFIFNDFELAEMFAENKQYDGKYASESYRIEIEETKLLFAIFNS